MSWKALGGCFVVVAIAVGLLAPVAVEAQQCLAPPCATSPCNNSVNCTWQSICYIPGALIHVAR